MGSPFSTQKASEKMFDAIADAIISGVITPGSLRLLGTEDGSISSMSAKLEIITPTAKEILGDNFNNYQSSISNEANVLAAGVERINQVGNDGGLTSDQAISALTKIVQTQSVARRCQ